MRWVSLVVDVVGDVKLQQRWAMRPIAPEWWVDVVLDHDSLADQVQSDELNPPPGDVDRHGRRDLDPKTSLLGSRHEVMLIRAALGAYRFRSSSRPAASRSPSARTFRPP
jgi:hypothetical protein